MVEGEAGKRPGEETSDLRRAEEGREEREETAVAGVTGAESRLLDEVKKGDSLRASEMSSVCAVAAESLRLLRRPVSRIAGALREELATAVEAPTALSRVADDAEAVLEVARAPAEVVAEDRLEARALEGELDLVRLRSTGIDETGHRYSRSFKKRCASPDTDRDGTVMSTLNGRVGQLMIAPKVCVSDRC